MRVLIASDESGEHNKIKTWIHHREALMNEYDQQAANFLHDTGTTFKAVLDRHGKHFPDDTSPRDIYRITLERGRRHYIFEFGQSIKDSGYYIDRDTKHHILCDGSRNNGLGKVSQKFIKQFCGRFSWDNKRHGAKAPDAYSVLACLQGSDPGDFEEFCDNFGYDTDSRQAMKTYKAVRDEFTNLERLFSLEELETLEAIA